MIISVTAPKKGLGQSVTVINLGAALVQRLEKRTLLIDLNHHCLDLSHYLSDVSWTKGLDEYVNMREGGIPWREGEFRKCVKGINPLMDMMAANRCLALSPEDLGDLLEHTKSLYGITLVDTIGGSHALTQEINKRADIVVVLLSQEARVLNLIREYGMYQGIKEKVVFVVNRWMEAYHEERVRFDLRTLGKAIRKMGFGDHRIFPLPFDPKLLNECNESTLLYFGFSQECHNNAYHSALNHIVNHLIGLGVFEATENNLQGISAKEPDRNPLLKLLQRWDGA